MKVCAEYEDSIAAFTAHRGLLDKGVDPEDIELRSPCPLAEHAVPPHRSKPMIMRNIVRLGWLTGLIGGFCFLTFTQWEWGLTAKTGGHPLVALPINSIIMYETGMITALLVTTLMFFVETRRYRQLNPPLEEDMIVANGYIALIVAGEKAKKAKEWLEGTNARSIVTYMLPLLFLGTMLPGCAVYNMREQQVIKPGQAPADLPPPHSLRMPTAEEAEVRPLEPLGWLYYGDQMEYERSQQEMRNYRAEVAAQVKEGTVKPADRNRLFQEKEEALQIKESEPKIITYESVPRELNEVSNPVEATEESLLRGEKLYKLNCAKCHGETGMGEGKVGEFWGGPGVVPHLGDAGTYSRYSDGYIYHYILVGKNQMPSFAYKLTTREVWDIVNHIRSMQKAS